jgi:small subunit ribosomal protein S1
VEEERDSTISTLTGSASLPDPDPAQDLSSPNVHQNGDQPIDAPSEVTPLHAQTAEVDTFPEPREAPEPRDEAPATPETVRAAAPPAAEAGRGPAAVQDTPARDDDDDAGEETMASLLNSPGNSLRELNRGDVLEGVVARIDQDEVLVDIGMKSEGVISTRELAASGEPMPDLHVGSQVLVYVMQPESQEGHAVLSLKRARMEQSWRKAEELMNADQTVEAEVIDYNKGGLIVDLGVRGFVPISQIPELRGLTKGPEGENSEVTERLAAMKGRRLPLKIIELNRSRNRLILSERLALQQMRASRKDDLLNELEPGQVRRGRVTSLCSFGAFVDLGGADGLVHISQLSYSRVNHPSEVLKVGDEVDVAVLSIDPQTKKIALSLKKALPDPWTLVEQRYQVGQLVEGTITKLAKFGAFAKIDDGIEGLIHLSELTDAPVENAKDVVNEGDRVTLRVININSQRRRLGLSLRQVAHPHQARQMARLVRMRTVPLAVRMSPRERPNR